MTLPFRGRSVSALIDGDAAAPIAMAAAAEPFRTVRREMPRGGGGFDVVWTVVICFVSCPTIAFRRYGSRRPASMDYTAGGELPQLQQNRQIRRPKRAHPVDAPGLAM